MASSQLPEGGLPFGYNFSDEPLLRPPPSPHGEPILGPSDNNWLGHFFTGLESNEYNTWSFGEGVDFSEQWFHQVAPNLLGHSTSYGPQPDVTSTAAAGLPSANFENVLAFEPDMMPPPPPPLPPTRLSQPSTPQQHRPQSQPTPHHFHQHLPQSFHDQRNSRVPIEQDAHAHAAALLALQSGHPNIQQPRTSSLNSFHSPSHVQPPGHHRGSFSQSIPTQNLVSPVPSARSNETDALFVNMILGSRGSTSQRLAEPPEFQFGSDPTFDRSQGFVPPQHESSEALEKKRIKLVQEALEYTTSTPNTQPSSPIRNKEVAVAIHVALENGIGTSHVEENAATSLKKRRRSKAKAEPEEDGEYAVQLPSKAQARKRKSKGDLNGSPESSSATQEVSGKRRKSAASQPKPPRENLTDAQKRENHIKSEQKRRGAIKEGFDDLVFIVPNLQNGGYSKSSMLNLAGDWLESLIKENQMMES